MNRLNNLKAARHLMKLWYEGDLNKEQTEVLEDILARALSYDGFADYEVFNPLFDVSIDETNWNPKYCYKIKGEEASKK